jgi:uncharacterized protein with HEPN domain
MRHNYESILRKHVNELFDILQQYSITNQQSLVSVSESNMVFQKAILMSVGYIGELSKKLDGDFKTEHPEIHWRRLGTSRNIIFHDYDIVDMRIIATVVFKDIKLLHSSLAMDE